jgi:DNA-binding NarL/FixJ family response regulator
MTRGSGAIRVIEEAYCVDRDDESWLQALLEALHPMLDDGLGTMAAYYRFTSARPEPGRIRTHGMKPDVCQAIVRLNASAPAEQVGAIFRTRPFASSIQKLRTIMDVPATELASVFPNPVVDIMDLNAQSPDGHGIMLSAPLLEHPSLRRTDVVRGERLAAHIAAAYRLRRGLQKLPSALTGADAILSPNGRVEHAEDPAKGAAARAALREAAVGIDRARTSKGRLSEDKATAAWQALVSGRWTLLDHFESDGRRILVARRNDPRVDGPTSLPVRTRQVLAYRALGHPLKCIAYELGLSTSTVWREVARGMSALGVRSTVELARLFGPSDIASTAGPSDE